MKPHLYFRLGAWWVRHHRLARIGASFEAACVVARVVWVSQEARRRLEEERSR